MPAPSLDRAEVATRLACADVQGSSLPLDVGRAAWAAQVVATADAIALALAPPVAGPCPGEDARDDAEARARIAAPVAPKSEAAKYEPRVGDVVRYDDTNAGDEMIVSRIEGGITYWRYLRVRGGADISSFQPSALRFIRPATPAERAAAGLPSPEATRPTHVRVTGPTGARFVTIGKTYRVIDRDEDCERLVILNDDDERWLLGQPGEINPAFPTWEPATPPAPVEPAKGEAVSGEVRQALIALVDAADWVMALLKSHGPSVVPHLLDTDENAGQRLRDVIAKAKSLLASTVRS